VQFATLAAVNKIPATYAQRDYVQVGGLMSYGTDLADMFHQVGVYTGNILKGAKPADLPVLQSTKFEFAVNLQTARALGIEVPSGVLSIADRVTRFTCCVAPKSCSQSTRWVIRDRVDSLETQPITAVALKRTSAERRCGSSSK
jgi:hypothetical protein